METIFRDSRVRQEMKTGCMDNKFQGMKKSCGDNILRKDMKTKDEDYRWEQDVKVKNRCVLWCSIVWS